MRPLAHPNVRNAVLVMVLMTCPYSKVGYAQNLPDFDRMSQAEIQAYREQFIRNFRRIGMNTRPEDARFLRILVKSSHAKRGIEVGSANGYGAIHMGMGFEYTGGHLFTIDIDPEMVRQCNENVRKMGLEKTVTCIQGDALEVLPKLEGTFDFVFIDARKSDYYRYFKAIEPKLAPGSVIVAHNAILFAYAMRDFLDAMQNDPNYDMVIVRTADGRDGMAVIHKME